MFRWAPAAPPVTHNLPTACAQDVNRALQSTGLLALSCLQLLLVGLNPMFCPPGRWHARLRDEKGFVTFTEPSMHEIVLIQDSLTDALLLQRTLQRAGTFVTDAKLSPICPAQGRKQGEGFCRRRPFYCWTSSCLTSPGLIFLPLCGIERYFQKHSASCLANTAICRASNEHTPGAPILF